jgi:hypothetical protein
MKRTFQIVAGIIIVSAAIFVGRLLLVEAAISRVSASVQRSTKQIQTNFEQTAARHRSQAEERKARAAEEERLKLEAGCYVITSDGRKFTCPKP